MASLRWALLPFNLQAIVWEIFPVLLASAFLSSSFHLIFLFSVRYLEAHIIAPLMYAEVEGGLWLFDQISNPYALIGIFMIVGAGLMVMLRGLIKSRAVRHS